MTGRTPGAPPLSAKSAHAVLVSDRASSFKNRRIVHAAGFCSCFRLYSDVVTSKHLLNKISRGDGRSTAHVNGAAT